jgi:hypothetical protein
VPRSISPKWLGKTCIEERASQKVPNGAIGPLCDTIQLWRMRRSQLVRDTSFREVLGKFRRDVLPTVVGLQRQDGEAAILFKCGTENFEAREDIGF